jgi:hypothetical protein
VLVSACSNRLKIRESIGGSIPMPVSDTVSRALASWRASRRSRRPPSAVNLMAFKSRFEIAPIAARRRIPRRRRRRGRGRGRALPLVERAGAPHPRPTQDGVERGPELVGQDGQKLVLPAITTCVVRRSFCTSADRPMGEKSNGCAGSKTCGAFRSGPGVSTRRWRARGRPRDGLKRAAGATRVDERSGRKRRDRAAGEQPIDVRRAESRPLEDRPGLAAEGGRRRPRDEAVGVETDG